MDIQEILFALQQKCYVDPASPILAAVSGGPDSLFLLDCLWRLNFPVIVAHLNHGLRPEAAQDAELVRQAAQARGLPFVSGEENVADYARQNQLSIEEAGRAVRYTFLFQEAQRMDAQAVATGHTADDQVETVLMHWLRGSGLSGLRGMAYRSLPNPWSSSIPLVRPLLATWREGINQELASQDLHPAQDASNQDTTYYRNRLRHEVLPYLERLNPGLRQRLWNLASIAQEEDQVIQELVETAWITCQVQNDPDWVSIQADALATQPPAIQRRLLRMAISQLRPGLRDIDFKLIEKARSFIQQPSRSRRADLAAGLHLTLNRGRLWLVTDHAGPGTISLPQMPGDPAVELSLSEEVLLGGGWRLEAQVVADPQGLYELARANPDPYQAWLDLERLTQPLTVCGRRPGDRFAPLGLDGHSLKLSDFMINVQMPQAARDGWPLVRAGDTIIWVPGYRLSQGAALQPDTTSILHLTLHSGERPEV